MTHPAAGAPRSGSARFARLLALAAMLGCGHTEPFGSRGGHTDEPFDPTTPVRLTLNRGADLRAAWLPDASGILYSTQSLERSEDICLARLPATGGRQLALICELSFDGSSLTEVLESAAPAVDGRLAYVVASSPPDALTRSNQGLVLATVQDPITRQQLLRIPYTIPSGRNHSGVSQLRWLSPHRLLWLGESMTILRPCPLCERETLRSGLDAVVLDADGVALPQGIPGTDYASGVSPGSNEDEVFYTLGGDTRVYRRLLSSGAVDVVHDFGPAGIVRDVHVIGNQMAAVVGGRVNFGTDPTLGPTQWDSGGTLHMVNLQDGSDMIIFGPGLFRRPQLSPAGTGIVAEVFPLIITFNPDETTDTTVSLIGDLYLFGQP